MHRRLTTHGKADGLRCDAHCHRAVRDSLCSGRDNGFFVVTVLTGDVATPTTAIFGGRYDTALRQPASVAVTNEVGDTRYLWSPDSRS